MGMSMKLNQSKAFKGRWTAHVKFKTSSDLIAKTKEIWGVNLIDFSNCLGHSRIRQEAWGQNEIIGSFFMQIMQSTKENKLL